MVYGEECTEYNDFDFSDDICYEFADTCQRAMCECFRQFLTTIEQSTDRIDREACMPMNLRHQTCCTNLSMTSPFKMYNADNAYCDEDGQLKQLE